MLPPGNFFEKNLLPRIKNKEVFYSTNVHIYDGDIDTDVLDIYGDLYWGREYKFIEETGDVSMAFAFPVFLGNVLCDVLVINQGLITGNVVTKNMSSREGDAPRDKAQIMGDLCVEEFLLGTGKGLWGGKRGPTLTVNGDVRINTLLIIESKNTVIGKEFSFPQIFVGDDSEKHTLYDTDWSLNSLEEVLQHFNEDVLNLKQWGDYVDFFFSEHLKLKEKYYRYLKS